MDRQPYHSPFPAWAIFFLALPLLLLAIASQGHPFEGEIEISSGYDDNITEAPEAKGSGFSSGRFTGEQPLLNETAPVHAAIGMEGTYRRYFSEAQRYQTSAFGRMSGKFWKDRLYPVLTLSGGIYRNENIPEDDMDWLEAKLHVDALVTAGFTLGAEGVYGRFDYKNPFSALHFRPMTGAGGIESSAPASPFSSESEGMGRNTAAGRWEMKRFEDPREDELSIGRLTGTVFMGPRAIVNLTLESGENRSTLKQKTHALTGISAGFTWKPQQTWQADVLFSYQRADYDDTPNAPDRTDDVWAGGLKISRFMGMFELFFQMDWLKDDSTVGTESYTKRVTQCGVAYSF